jgi:hypothetical protein
MGLVKKTAMAFDERGQPVRRGIAKYLTIDLDAIAALEELAVGPGAQGRLVSELLRQEIVRREERQQTTLADVGASDD